MIESKKTIPEISIDTRLLYDKLLTVNPGEIIKYQELSQIIGKNVQAEGRCYTDSARRILLNTEGAVFEAITNVGLKRLTDEEVASTAGQHAIKRIRNISRTATRKLISIKDFDALSNEAKKKHNMSLSVFGMLKMMTKPSSITKIESSVSTNAAQISYNETMKLFDNRS